MNPSPARSQTVCILRCGELLYGLPAAHIREVMDWRQPVPVPLAPPYVAGVVAHKGDVLTVIRLSCLLELGASPVSAAIVVLEDPSSGEPFALAVGRVEQVISLAQKNVQPLPANSDTHLDTFVRGICHSSGESLRLLNLASLTPDSLCEQLGLSEEARNEGKPCVH